MAKERIFETFIEKLELLENVHGFMYKGAILFHLEPFKKIGDIQTSELYCILLKKQASFCHFNSPDTILVK